MFDWSQQTVLLTGGTGSFGQAFTEYLINRYPPKALRIYSRDEFKQYQMQQRFDHECLRYFIGDVRDKSRLMRAMNGVSVVVHAAAMKQIVACEYNPSEAVQTNVIGSMHVVESALDAGVDRVIGIITDKAVSPVNLYGATKLCMEKLLVRANSYRGRQNTRFSCIRYGNVAGSRGSVIPLFLKHKTQARLPITHPDATRFWITLEGGVRFVIRAIQAMRGGEIFVPKMPSVRVVDLATAIAPKAEHHVIGLRTGEKLHEDIITVHEAKNVASFADHFIIKPELIFWSSRKDQTEFGGKPVPSDFRYMSETNDEFLSVAQLRAALRNLRFI